MNEDWNKVQGELLILIKDFLSQRDPPSSEESANHLRRIDQIRRSVFETDGETRFVPYFGAEDTMLFAESTALIAAATAVLFTIQHDKNDCINQNLTSNPRIKGLIQDNRLFLTCTGGGEKWEWSPLRPEPLAAAQEDADGDATPSTES